MPPWRLAILLLTFLTIAEGRDALGAVKTIGKKRKFCTSLPKDSTAAAETVLSTWDGTPYSDFRVGLKRSGMEDAFRALCKGKVAVVPSNAAMGQRFVKRGLYFADHKIPKSAVRAFKQFVPSTCMSRNTIPAEAGCNYDVYVQFELGNLGRIRGLRSGVSAAADVYQDGMEADQFSVLGQGYNLMNGFPLAYGMSSLDPGFTLTPIFRLNASHVRSLGTLGGQCESKFSTSTFSSVRDMKTSLSASMSVSLDFKIVEFKGNANFNALATSTMTSQTVTSVSNAKVYLGGYGLMSGPAGLVLDPGFIESIAPMINAAAVNDYDPYAMRTFMDNYGTHYIRSVQWGGLASVVSQMTASSLSSMASLGISVGVGAQVAVVSFDASFNYDASSTKEVQKASSTFSMVMIPSGVKLAMVSPGVGPGGTPLPSFIDCTTWSQSLIEAESLGWKAPISYSLAKVADILSYRHLFPEDMRYLLPKAQKALYDFQTTCGYTTDLDEWVANIKRRKSSCPFPPKAENECVIGTYKTNAGACVSCYGDGTAAGPNCNSSTTVACTLSSCFCMPVYAYDYEKYKCIPLAANPPAPPAMTLSELLKQKKKK